MTFGLVVGQQVEIFDPKHRKEFKALLDEEEELTKEKAIG